MTVYALVHNAATRMRNVVLRFGDEPNGKRPRIRVIGGEGRASRRRAVLPAMQPGENRWLSFTIESGGEDGATTMEEVLDNAILNGFAIEPRTLSDSDFAVETARYHASILWRLAEAFGLDELFDYAKRAFELAEDPKAYPKLLAEAAEQFPRWTGELIGGWEGGDPFRVRTQARNLTRIDPSAPEAAAAHASLLHALDAFATMRLKAGGDLADVLQTVEWLVRLLRDERLGGEANAEAIRACEHFVFSYSERRGNPDDYVELIKAILDRLERVARSADVDDELVEALRRALGDPTALQRAHRQLLIALGEAIGAP